MKKIFVPKLTIMLFCYLCCITSNVYSNNTKKLAGKLLYYTKGCHSCHGYEGNDPASPEIPILKDQNQPYLLKQSKDILAGTRTNSLSGLMKNWTQDSSVEELVAITTYLSSITRSKSVKKEDK